MKAWVLKRLVCLNDQSEPATRKGDDGLKEYHQKHQDFVGPTQTHRDFQREHQGHPRLGHVSRSKITDMYPWFSVKGKPENCVCHIHYGLALCLADYHYNAPGFHRTYAAQFSGPGPVRPTITCATCKDHPFNGPKRFAGNERLRVLQRTSQAMQSLLCPHATTPGPQANVDCCQNKCSKCGWDQRVQRCAAEWSDSGTFHWRQVVYEEIEQGHTKRKHYVVKKVSGTPRQQLEYLRSIILKFGIHHFLARWQAWVMREIPRQMPENHYTSLADYIMKYKHGDAYRQKFQSHHFSHHTITILCFVTKTVVGLPGPGRTVTNHGYIFMTHAEVPYPRRLACAFCLIILMLQLIRIPSTAGTIRAILRPLRQSYGARPGPLVSIGRPPTSARFTHGFGWLPHPVQVLGILRAYQSSPNQQEHWG
jgi:hypothetical protein